MKQTILYRPTIHFSAPNGWINDPNGLLYENGRYHLFYQHNPDATHWGPMHWGHAVSKDLLHWKVLPIALYPDSMGTAFSGSAVLYENPAAGFGEAGRPAIAACYTCHDMKSGREAQCIAWSNDYIHFEKYSGNPVIPGEAGKNSRDPKIFRNPSGDGFCMALATEGYVSFYASKDLLHWEKTGAFHAGDHGLSGICECPDCFPMETPEGTKWVLIVSMIVPDHEAEKYTAGNHVTQYYIGDFDGTVFKDTQLSDKVLLLDDGPDFYAGVTFNGTDRPIMMGWADNWCYANDTPAKEEGFQGQMTSARELSLKKCEDGYRVASSILIPFDPKQYVSLPEEKEFKTKLSNCNAVDIHTKITPGGSITFENEEGNVFLLRCTKDSYIIDRTKAGRNNFSPQFAEGAMGVIRIPRKNPNEKQIRLIHDGCLFELEADEGMTTASVCTYPNNPYTQATFSGCTEGMLGYIH